MGMLDELRSLGVAAGDRLMVHASMRAVGGRAEALIQALIEAVGPRGGLLSLICGPEDIPFDPETSPAWEDLGVFAEVFRTFPGVVRNPHPIARFGAWGEDAHRWVEDPPLHDYYGADSPLERWVRADGSVLRLGADRDTTTLLHYAESLAEIPNKRRITHRVLIATPTGPQEIEVHTLDDEAGIRPFTGDIDYFERILDDALAHGVGRVGQVGGATAELLPARALVMHAKGWMERNLDG